MPENGEVSYDWMDITERGYKTLMQAGLAGFAAIVLNGWINDVSMEPTVLVNAVIPVGAATISFGWNTLKGYRSARKKELVLND